VSKTSPLTAGPLKSHSVTRISCHS